jgi:hypothetical protein
MFVTSGFLRRTSDVTRIITCLRGRRTNLMCSAVTQKAFSWWKAILGTEPFFPSIYNFRAVGWTAHRKTARI